MSICLTASYTAINDSFGDTLYLCNKSDTLQEPGVRNKLVSFFQASDLAEIKPAINLAPPSIYRANLPAQRCRQKMSSKASFKPHLDSKPSCHPSCKRPVWWTLCFVQNHPGQTKSQHKITIWGHHTNGNEIWAKYKHVVEPPPTLSVMCLVRSTHTAAPPAGHWTSSLYWGLLARL